MLSCFWCKIIFFFSSLGLLMCFKFYTTCLFVLLYFPGDWQKFKFLISRLLERYKLFVGKIHYIPGWIRGELWLSNHVAKSFKVFWIRDMMSFVDMLKNKICFLSFYVFHTIVKKFLIVVTNGWFGQSQGTTLIRFQGIFLENERTKAALPGFSLEFSFWSGYHGKLFEEWCHCLFIKEKKQDFNV